MAILKALGSSALYTVGWIAALPIERAAATAILDERHDEPCGFVQHQADTNSYTWGKVGKHNVVIASLPAGMYGTTSAATTASNLLSSLPQIRIGLLVGIGGGIPRSEQRRDIRLGDVVVSQPQGTTGGVVQYDLGKATSNQRWERRDFLSMPPQVLLHALANLQAEHELGESRIPEFIEDMLQKMIRTGNAAKVNTLWGYQGRENDWLFNSSYDHELGGYDCRNCNPTEKIERSERDTTGPEIHYGIIASGNTLLKDAATRDKIVDDIGEECICFEMEAAGLMNQFPCIVIRGICDYADSHKNDRWQRYASATAAAYGKELIGYIPSRGLQETQRALDVLRSMDQEIKEIHASVRQTNKGLRDVQAINHFNCVVKWLSSPNPSTNLNKSLKKRQQGTGTWFLQSRQFQQWKAGKSRYLWLNGIPGCGKTVLSATIIENLNHGLNSSHIVLYFFFDFTNPDKQSFQSLIRSLIAQMYSKHASSREELDRLFSSSENGHLQPTEESLLATFTQMMNTAEKVQIVIDSLDECKTRRDLLLWMESFAGSRHEGLYLLATSRKEDDIESELTRWLDKGDYLSIRRDLVADDIGVYVRRRLRNDRCFQRWHSKPTVLDEIETELIEKADGMFRWVACQLDTLQKCLDLPMLRQRLRSLPTTLEETYSRILADIDEVYRDKAIRILQFLTYSERPLTIEEVVDIIAVDLEGNSHFDPSFRMPKPQEILSLCSSLVSLGTRSSSDNGSKRFLEVQLAHFSVQQFLKSDRIVATFPRRATKIGTAFQFGLHEFNARRSIARTCLTYLSCLDEQRTVDEIVAEFPFAQYAARYWMNNAELTEGDAEVLASIMKFFLEQSQAYTAWGKLYDPDDPWIEEPFSSGEEMATPLYYASLTGLQRTAQALTEQGAIVNAKGGDYGNALQAASGGGYKEIVQLLLEKGAEVNARGGVYGNALQASSEHGHEEIVQLLLEKGADINAQTGDFNDNALQAASGQGHKEIVQLLLEKGANINTQGGYYNNALQAASAEGHHQVVQLLLKNGAEINMLGGAYGNALRAASENGHKEVVEMLIEGGAVINAQGDCSGTKSLQAASGEGHKEIVQLLLDKGADVNGQGSAYSNTWVASENGYKDTLQILLERGAKINPRGDDIGGNALHVASGDGHKEIVQLLLEKGANINTQGGYYSNALQAASARGHYQVVQLLLEKGADINAQGGAYGNALRAASLRGHCQIVQLLLERRHNVDAQGAPK